MRLIKKSIPVIFLLFLTAHLAAQNSNPVKEQNNAAAKTPEKKADTAVKTTTESAAKDTAKDPVKKAEPDKNKTDQKKPAIEANAEKKETEADKKIKAAAEREKIKANNIIKTINYGVNQERKAAINGILTIKDETVRKPLEEKLIEIINNEIDLEVKIKAITVAGELKLKSATPAILGNLNNESVDIQTSCVYAIKRIGDESAKQPLINKLKEQDVEKNRNLIEALIDVLGDFKAVELREFAEEAIKSNSSPQPVKELYILFLGKIKSVPSKELLVNILKDEDENIQSRCYAASSLAKLEIKETAKDVEEVMKKIDSYPFNKKKNYFVLYSYCLAALVKLGDENALPRLLNALRSDNSVVRLRAVELLKEMKDKRTIDILKYKVKYDPSPKVQSLARKALKEMGVEVDGASDVKDDKPEENPAGEENKTDDNEQK